MNAFLFMGTLIALIPTVAKHYSGAHVQYAISADRCLMKQYNTIQGI